jgi:hypothetical protein
VVGSENCARPFAKKVEDPENNSERGITSSPGTAGSEPRSKGSA